jgi:ESCRT-II complex subunit VPS36
LHTFQLGEFLRKQVEKEGGMMPLPDAYCIYNRARQQAMDLVSPADLLKAVKLFTKVGVPLRLRELPSGAKVIQAASHDEDAMCKKLTELALMGTGGSADAIDGGCWVEDIGPGISRTEAAANLKVGLGVAGEYLEAAEERRLLCRDEGPEGTRYYRNFFFDAGTVVRSGRPVWRLRCKWLSRR